MSDTQNTVAAVKKELLTRLGHDADIFVLISLCTREPYVVCDPETFDDEVFLYLNEEEAKTAAAGLAEQKIPATIGFGCGRLPAVRTPVAKILSTWQSLS